MTSPTLFDVGRKSAAWQRERWKATSLHLFVMPTTVWPRAQKMLYKLVKDTQTKYTETAAISMSCHRHNRNNTRCTMAGRTKQEEATRIQSWSTQAARVAQEEESNWQTSHGYNPHEHGPTSWQKGAEDKCKMNFAARRNLLQTYIHIYIPIRPTKVG